jgi:ribulose-bisphosphate carboxylase large chain
MEKSMEKESVKVSYLIEPKVESIERATELLLAEMTSGIQYVSTREGVEMGLVRDSVPFVDDSINGEVVSLEEQGDGIYLVEFSFPSSNVDVALGGISNLWPIIAGEVFNFYFIKKAALTGLFLPLTFKKYYMGPGYGIAGIRELLNAYHRPLFGCIIKPNLGLDPERTSRVVSILARAGFDFIKDDEICVNPDLCPLEQRVRSIAKTIETVQQQTGKRVLYAANVTSDFSVLGKAAETAVQSGAGGLMIDPFCVGLSSIDYLRRNFNLPIYLHRVGYGIFCYNPSYSISYEVFTSLFRLLGGDFSHVGGIWGKSDEARKKTADYVALLRKKDINKAAWPVVTGISLENMKDYYDFYGDDTMFMDHIDIYKDEASSKEKLQSLKRRMSG